MKALKIKKADHKEPKLENSRLDRLPWYIFMGAVGVVLVSFVLIYLVDLRNLFGSRDFLISRFSDCPFLMRHLFTDGMVIELFQWALIGGTALVSMFVSGIMYKKDRTTFLFWAVISVAFILMLIEDAGNSRHTIRIYLQSIFINQQEHVGLIFTTLYFTCLASIPIYAFVHYRKPVMKHIRSARYLITGFISYALAASLSFFELIIPIRGEPLYIYVGGKLRSSFIFLADDNAQCLWDQYEATCGRFPLEFYIVDWLIEESIELVAAAAFCASAVAFLLYVRKAYRL